MKTLRTSTTPLPKTEQWKLLAACHTVPTQTFYPTSATAGDISIEAHRICRTCPVKYACLEWAVKNRIIDGYWGDTSGRERKRLLRQRRTRLDGSTTDLGASNHDNPQRLEA